MADQDFGKLNLNPDEWVDPTETFPGKVVASAYRMADEKYKEANQFREAITEDLPQWDLRIERLDAEYGSISPVVLYGGVDMKVLDKRSGKLIDVSSKNFKSFTILSAWRAVFGRMDKPEDLVGKFFMFERKETMKIPGFASGLAKNVILPVSILEDGYVFTGTKQTREFTPKDDQEEEAEGGEDGTRSLVPVLTDEEIKARLAVELDGKEVAGLASVLGTLPPELRTNQTVNRLINGELVKEMEEDGLITVNGSGVIGLAA